MLENNLFQKRGHAVINASVDAVGDHQIYKIGILDQSQYGRNITSWGFQHCRTRQRRRKRRFLLESCTRNKSKFISFVIFKIYKYNLFFYFPK